MGTVDRVLPWRRHSPPPADEVAPLIAGLPRPATRRRPPARSCGPTRSPPTPTAARSASRASATSTTRCRWPSIVADIGLDDTTIAAALLHDAVEDTEVTPGRPRRGVRARRRRHRRRRHQARPARASTPRRSSRPPPCARCWWRWPRTSGSSSSSWPTGSTTCARSPPCRRGEAAAHRPGDPRHLRAAGPPPRACRS